MSIIKPSALNSSDNFIKRDDKKSVISIHQKVFFDQSRFKNCMNIKHLQLARAFNLVLLIFILVEFLWGKPFKAHYGFHKISHAKFYHYSLWAILSALVAMIASMLASNFTNWYRIAFLINEITYAINIINVPLFWGALWP